MGNAVTDGRGDPDHGRAQACDMLILRPLHAIAGIPGDGNQALYGLDPIIGNFKLLKFRQQQLDQKANLERISLQSLVIDTILGIFNRRNDHVGINRFALRLVP